VLVNHRGDYSLAAWSDPRLAAAVGISAGAALQAFAGYRMTRGIVGETLEFKRARGLLQFAGAVAASCLISATVAMLVLEGLHLASPAERGFQWLTWWYGDTVGVLLVTPVLLALAGENRKTWRARGSQNAAVVCVGLALIAVLAWKLAAAERERALAGFRVNTEHVAQQLESSLQSIEKNVYQLATVMRGRVSVGGEEFARYAAGIASDDNVVYQAVEWAPLVSDAGRAAFEREQRKGRPQFVISEIDASGNRVAAARRSEYVAVAYAEPYRGNEKALGFDLASNAVRRTALELSKQMRTPIATLPVRLVQESGKQFGLLVVQWVNGGGSGTGAVLMVLRMGDFVGKIAVEHHDKQLMLRLSDAQANEAVLFDSFDETVDATFRQERVIGFGQRQYRLEMAPRAALIEAARSLEGWGMLMGVLIALVALSYSVLLARLRTSRFEALVEQRTDELHDASRLLYQSEKLAALGQLSAGIAHEINNPIGYISSNISMLGKYLEQWNKMVETCGLRAADGGLAVADWRQIQAQFGYEGLRRDIDDLLAESQEGIKRVCTIVSDLKAFARADADISWAQADLHQCITTTLNLVNNEIKYCLKVELQFGEIPLIDCISSQLNQVFLNLIVNAGQAIADGEMGTLTIRTGKEGEGRIWLEFEDSGAGMDEAVMQKVFDPFFTTKEVGVGTGLGLSISHGIVQRHGGEIAVRSKRGAGTCFRLVLPISQREKRESDKTV